MISSQQLFAVSGSSFISSPKAVSRMALSLVMIAVLGLSACGKKEKKPGQAIAVVNGEEITTHQLEDELLRANVQQAQRDAASKQLTESLIDRQLLLAEATKDKTDRDPKVLQTVERAKAQIIAQYYMQKKLASIAKPTKTEIEEYYKKNPMFFGERKVFDMKQIQFAGKENTEEMKKVLETAKSLDEVAAYLTEKKIQFGRGQSARSTSDLPPEMTSKMLSMPKEQLFMVNEGDRSTLLAINEIKDAPVTLEQASGQIEQFLLSKKNKEAADAEIKRLRANAKIEYLKASASASASASAAASAADAASSK